MLDLSRADEERLVFWGLLLAGAYVAYDTWRNSAAASSEGSFGGQAPTALEDLGDTASPLQLSPAGEAFIKNQEGWTPTVKNDAGHREIGWGHDIQPGENITGPITKIQGQQLFDGDAAIAVQAVNNAVKAKLTQNQFDALVDLAFDIGASGFAGSTLVQQLNQGNYSGAAQQFARWNKSQGSVNNGLMNRRAAETGLFNT